MRYDLYQHATSVSTKDIPPTAGHSRERNDRTVCSNQEACDRPRRKLNALWRLDQNQQQKTLGHGETPSLRFALEETREGQCLIKTHQLLFPERNL
jgi:hypothetical protein